MQFVKRTSNVRIVVTKKNKKDNSCKTKTYSLYSSLSFDDFKRVVNSFSDSHKVDSKLYLTFFDTTHNKSRKFIISSLNSENEMMELIKKKILANKNSLDLQKTRYQLKISNHFTSVYDSKIMSFHSKLEFEKVFVVIKDKIKKIVDEHNKKIIFVDEKLNSKRKSHSVVLKKGKYSKSFSIFLPNYSSREILEML